MKPGSASGKNRGTLGSSGALAVGGIWSLPESLSCETDGPRLAAGGAQPQKYRAACTGEVAPSPPVAWKVGGMTRQLNARQGTLLGSDSPAPRGGEDRQEAGAGTRKQKTWVITGVVLLPP